jgi:hypothetical protein
MNSSKPKRKLTTSFKMPKKKGKLFLIKDCLPVHLFFSQSINYFRQRKLKEAREAADL